MPAGRPFKFTPEEFQKAWEDYFKYCEENPVMKTDAIRSGERAGEILYIPVARPYTEVGFCAFHGLGEKYLSELSDTLAKHEDSEAKQLSHILTHNRAKCYEQKYSGAAAGVYNANIIARSLGLVDKTESKVTVEPPLFSDEDKE